MPFTVITKPAVGDPTKKQAFADLVVDDLNFLYNLMLSTIGSREIITNGSFESDVDADAIPDNWTRTLYTGGSFSHETSTSAASVNFSIVESAILLASLCDLATSESIVTFS